MFFGRLNGYQIILFPLILDVDVISYFLRWLVPMICLGCILKENDSISTVITTFDRKCVKIVGMF